MNETMFSSSERMPRSILLILGLLLVVSVTLVALLVVAGASPRRFKGLDLEKTPAPDFRLMDQDGKTVALSDLRGKVVVLTFVYSQCRDICPIIALKLSKAYADLDDVKDQVRIVAVSVAPELDTPISIAKFSQETQMHGKWLYLTGTRAELQSVWQAYYLAVATPVSQDTPVGHQSRVVLIDSAGKERVHFSPDFNPDDLVHDVRLLVQE